MGVSTVKLNNQILMTVNDTTAIASDVVQNKYFYNSAGEKTVGTSTGGGGRTVEPGDVTFIDYDGTVVASYSANEVIEAFDNLSERITPVTYDYEPGWVAIGKWFNEDSTNNHTDVYAVQRGHTYICKLGSVVGNAFRSIILPVHPRDTTDTTEGILITEKTGQHPNDEVAFTADIDGYYLVTKDHASTPGLQTYFYEVLDMNLLPDNPSHLGLIAQGWNYSVGQIYDEVKSVGQCVVGQMYVTDDGKTRFYIHLGGDGERFAVRCRRTSNNFSVATIDWGDGSSVDNITTTAQTISHTYSVKGDYVVQITAIISGTGYVVIGGGSSSTVGYGEIAHRPKLTKVELGENVSIDGYGFYYCYGLKSITIPREAPAFGSYALACCSGLDAVVFPSGWTTMYSNLLYQSRRIKHVSIPCSITNIQGSVFYECYYVRSVIPSAVTTIGTYYRRSCYNSKDEIVVPSGVSSLPNYFAYDNALVEKITLGSITSIGQYALYGCYSLRKLDVPSSVTSINTYAFAACYNILEYHFKSTTPPSLSGTNAFNNIPSNCKIYVPYSADHSVLEAYKTATNWSAYASQIVEERVNLINMTPVTITDHGVDYVITQNRFTTAGTAADTFLRTLQDNISCLAGTYEFDFGSLITSSNFMLQLFNVTDNSIIYSFGSWDASPTYTFTLSEAKTLRIRTTIFEGAVVDEDHELHLYLNS